jgi:hypothetical protein
MQTINDRVLTFASDAAEGWVILRSDGQKHETATALILRMLMISCTHEKTVHLTLDGKGVITSVQLMFSK